VAGELHGEVAGKAPSILNQHDPYAVLLAIVEQSDEAGASVDRISPADRGVIEGLGDLVPTGGIGGDSLGLAALAILFGTHIGGAARPKIGDTGRNLSRDVVSPLVA
jgi:hypothetical protein